MSRICLIIAIVCTAVPAAAWPPSLLERPEGSRIGEAFPAPDSLEPAIAFWKQIFTQHGSDRVVLHDEGDLGVVWEVIDLPLDDDGDVNRRAAKKVIRQRTEELKKRLRRLERKREARDDEDMILLSLVGGADSPRLKGAWKRIRAQRGIADNVRLGLQRSKQWLPKIRETLEREGVPLELAALPFIESTFNPLAHSSAGAAGLWQLMPATARQYGLVVNDKRDERLNVVKATEAAARLLADNFDMLGTWPLAITGYNHGPYGVRRAVTAAGSTDIAYLIENYDGSTWGFASKNFYAEFVAVLRVLQSGEHAELAFHSDAHTDGTNAEASSLRE